MVDHLSKAYVNPRRTAPPWVPVVALSIWSIAMIGLLTIDDPRLRFGTHVVALAVATLAWLYLMRTPPTGRAIFAIVAIALIARIAGLCAAPAFSDDVFRYVYEGRVVWYRGPAFVFVHAPAMGPELGVPSHLIDETWLRINHAQIPTIYPPASQLVFAIAGGLGELFGGHLRFLKALLVAAELGAIAFVAGALAALGRPRAEAAALLLCPSSILEIAREGHADSLAILGLAIGAWGLARGRPRIGYLGWAAAALAKLNGLVALVALVRTTRRGVLVTAPLLALLALPFLLAGLEAGEGLGQYATRWRAGDGVFSILLLISEALLGGTWNRIAGVTVTSHQIARVLTAIIYVAAATRVLWGPVDIAAIPERAGALLTLLLLLSPTLHPWYTLWLLPFVVWPGRFRRPMIALIALAPLSHHAVWVELVEGVWRESPWIRAAVHVPAWGLLVIGSAARAPASRRSAQL